MAVPFTPRIDFAHNPTGWNFINDMAPVQLIRGPFGSGKTVACCAKVMMLALSQEPSPKDNIRYFKAAIVRNTSPQLQRTTIQTWLSLFPEQECGPMRYSAPMRHLITVPATDEDPGLHLEVEFFALDKVKDVRELLSWEGTVIFFNEVREIPKPIIDAATGRVGRYPSMEKGGVMPTWYGVIGDTNPPDEHHWYYMAEAGQDPISREYIGTPAGWSFHVQPPAVLQVNKAETGEHWVSADDAYPDIVEENPDLILHAAGRLWIVNPMAENLPNLPVHRHVDPSMNPRGRGSYYGQMIQGKALDWIQVYMQGRFGYVREGKPVIEEFNMDIHVTDSVDFSDNFPIDAGIDMGGNTLQPAGVLGQRTFRGQVFIGAEVIGTDMGLDRFSQQLIQVKARDARDLPWGRVGGDPAGRVKDGIYETVAFDHMISKGVPVLPAHTNDIGARIDATKAPFNRMIDGKPGILIHRRCSQLIQALNGKWHYRMLQRVSQGEAVYTETPEKNHPYSDLGDGLSYKCMITGETAALVAPPPSAIRTPENPFGVSDQAAAHHQQPATPPQNWNPFDA